MAASSLKDTNITVTNQANTRNCSCRDVSDGGFGKNIWCSLGKAKVNSFNLSFTVAFVVSATWMVVNDILLFTCATSGWIPCISTSSSVNFDVIFSQSSARRRRRILLAREAAARPFSGSAPKPWLRPSKKPSSKSWKDCCRAAFTDESISPEEQFPSHTTWPEKKNRSSSSSFNLWLSDLTICGWVGQASIFISVGIVGLGFSIGLVMIDFSFISFSISWRWALKTHKLRVEQGWCQRKANWSALQTRIGASSLLGVFALVLGNHGLHLAILLSTFCHPHFQNLASDRQKKTRIYVTLPNLHPIWGFIQAPPGRHVDMLATLLPDLDVAHPSYHHIADVVTLHRLSLKTGFEKHDSSWWNLNPNLGSRKTSYDSNPY